MIYVRLRVTGFYPDSKYKLKKKLIRIPGQLSIENDNTKTI